MIKQYVPCRVCIKCPGCCRFREADSLWQPQLLENEATTLSKSNQTSVYITKNRKICLIASKNKDIFYCAFFDICKNKCRIYSHRPFECQLYPFLINRRDKEIFLSIDRNCPFINENIRNKTFQKYANYLAKLLTSKKYQQILKNNPQVIQYYPGAQDIAKLDL